jgi:RNA polymerase sigma-32 factor
MDQRLEGGDLSLNAPLEEDAGQTYMDVLSSPETLEETVADAEFKEILARKIQEFTRTLKGKEVFLLEHRIMADEPLTLQEAGDRLKISRERARQIEKRVVEKIRTYLKDQFPDLEDIQVLFKRLAPKSQGPRDAADSSPS